MDFETSTETWAKTPFGRGQIVCEQEIKRCVSHYGPIPVVQSRIIVHEDESGVRRRLSGPYEIPQLCTASALAEQIGAHPKQWADVLSFFHDLGTVLYPSPRFGALASYGMDLADIAPRVKSGRLHFVTGKFGLESDRTPINHVSSELSTLVPFAQFIMNLEDLERDHKWAFRL